jgi:hypothetical protein
MPISPVGPVTATERGDCWDVVVSVISRSCPKAALIHQGAPPSARDRLIGSTDD